MILYIVLILASALLALTGDVLPGIPWYDTNNGLIQAHGGGIVKEGDTFFWIGENKSKGGPGAGLALFNKVSCYKSKDLLSWEWVSDPLNLNVNIPDLSSYRIVERPKVVFNANTNKYVMWMHIDSPDYKDARAGVAVADSICGQYQYLNGVRPGGKQSRDMTIFVDDDRAGYLVAEDRAEGTHFFRLTADYLSVDSTVGTIPFSFSPALESPAVIKVNGVYFFFGSELTGWAANENRYATATSLAGPWNGPSIFAPAGSKTCQSQTTFILSTGNDSYMYMGDRWFEDRLDESRFIWLPLTIDGQARTASMECKESWATSDIGVAS